MAKLSLSKKQELADKFTEELLSAEYGERFTSLENIEDDEELNKKWNYLNEIFYNVVNRSGIYIVD